MNAVVTIPAGGTQHIVEIQIGVDYDIEDTESFEVVLSNPSEDAVIAQSVATINIGDIDSEFNYVHLNCSIVNDMEWQYYFPIFYQLSV